MAEFGWAYVAGGAITGAVGPTGSIQIKAGATELIAVSLIKFHDFINVSRS